MLLTGPFVQPTLQHPMTSFTVTIFKWLKVPTVNHY